MGLKKIDNDLDFQGSKIVNAKMDTFSPAVATVTTATTLGSTHCTVILNAATNTTDIAFTLPAASTATGRIHQLIADKGNITITITGGGTVKDGGGTVATVPWKKKLTIQSDGTNWHSLTQFNSPNPASEPPAIFDDFIAVPPSIVSGTAAAVSLVTPSQTNRMGIVNLETGSMATGSAFIGDLTGSTTMFGSGPVTYAASIQIPALSSATQRFQVLVGLFTQSGQLDQTNGIYLLYDNSGATAGSTASPDWQRVTASANARTIVATTSAIVVNDWNNLRIETNAAGTSVGFYINGTLVGTSTTNVPRNALGFCGPGILIRKSIGTASASVRSDWTFLRANYTQSPRGVW